MLAENARKAAARLDVLADADVPAAVATFAAPQLPPVVEFGTAEFNRLAGQAMWPTETESVEEKIDRTNVLLNDLLGAAVAQIGAMGAVVNLTR